MKLKYVLAFSCLLAGLGMVGAVPAWAGQEPNTTVEKTEKQNRKLTKSPSRQDRPFELGEITVKGQGLHRNDLPTTVNIITAEQFEMHHGIRLEEMLNEVPGIYISNLGKGGVVNSIRMRGFTSGGHGGDVGLFLDGIPLNEGESHSDGYADMNVIIPLEIDRLEIFKGPSSALYGNFSRGGVLAFYTKRYGQYNMLDMEYGSFGTWNTQGAFGHELIKDLYNNTAFQVFHTDGYRDHSDWDRMNFSTRFTYDVSNDLDLGLSFRAHKSTWNASNNIPQWQFDNDDKIRDLPPNGQDDGGDKKYLSQRFDLGYNINKELRLLYWAYATQQDFTRFQTRGYYPSVQTEYFYDRWVLGTGTSLNLETKLAQRSLTGVFGIEVYDEITDTDVWGTYNRQRNEHQQRRQFDITTYSLFAQTEYELSRYFRPMVGLRYDTFRGSLENKDPGQAHYTQDMNDFEKFSPKIGFRSMLLDNLDFRASYCEGYALPSSSQKFDPKIQVDPVDLKQYEVGLNYSITNMLWVDLAYFILDSDGEIQENPIGSGVYTNLGETRRRGLEAGVRIFPLAGLELFATLTLNDTEVLKNADASLVGKEISRVPEHVFNLGAQYNIDKGLGGRINWRQVGEYYVDADNLHSYDGYDVVNASIFYTIVADNGGKYKISFSVDNLLDERYSDSVSYSEGTLTYAPAWPRTYWLGVTLEW